MLSKLCQSEQEEKQKFLLQSQQVKAQLDERVDKCCQLYDEVELLKKTMAEMKTKVTGADKANFEIQKIKDLLAEEIRQKESAERKSADSKDKIKRLND